MTALMEIMLSERDIGALIIDFSRCHIDMENAVAMFPRYFMLVSWNFLLFAVLALVSNQSIGPMYPHERWRMSVKNSVRMSVFLMKSLISLCKNIKCGLVT